MAKKKDNLKTTKTDSQASEVKTTEEKISFETYIAKAKIKNTLVASFKYEALKTEKALQDRSEAEWKNDFEAQSKRKY